MAIVGFVFFLFAVFSPSFLPKDSVITLYTFPVVIIIFASLFFASYNLGTATTITTAQNTSILNDNASRTTYEYGVTTTYFTENAFSWMFLGLACLSLILFLWDVWQHLKFG